MEFLGSHKYFNKIDGCINGVMRENRVRNILLGFMTVSVSQRHRDCRLR